MVKVLVVFVYTGAGGEMVCEVYDDDPMDDEMDMYCMVMCIDHLVCFIHVKFCSLKLK